MKLFILAIVLVACVTAEPPVRVRGGIYISQPEEDYQSTLPVVNTRRCGGPGNGTQLRVDGCTEGKGGACRIPADGRRRRCEYEFVPSANIEALGIRLIVREGGVTDIYERAISDSDVKQGELYILNLGVTVNEKHKGKTMTVQSIIYRQDTNEVETCLEADFEHY